MDFKELLKNIFFNLEVFSLNVKNIIKFKQTEFIVPRVRLGKVLQSFEMIDVKKTQFYPRSLVLFPILRQIWWTQFFSACLSYLSKWSIGVN